MFLGMCMGGVGHLLSHAYNDQLLHEQHGVQQDQPAQVHRAKMDSSDNEETSSDENGNAEEQGGNGEQRSNMSATSSDDDGIDSGANSNNGDENNSDGDSNDSDKILGS